MFSDAELNINTTDRKLLLDIRELLIEQNKLLKKFIEEKNKREVKKNADKANVQKSK